MKTIPLIIGLRVHAPGQAQTFLLKPKGLAGKLNFIKSSMALAALVQTFTLTLIFQRHQE